MNKFYVAGTNLKDERSVTVFATAEAAFARAAKYVEQPLQDRGAAVEYVAHGDEARIAEAEAAVAEAEKWAEAMGW